MGDHKSGRNDPCWCGSGKKLKKCHEKIIEVSPDELPSFESRALTYRKKYGILIKSPEQVRGIKQACLIATRILEKLAEACCEGITTLELDELSMKLHKEENVIPAPLGYGSPPYPKSICTSINEVICHGIPDQTVLKKGDMLNIDVSCIWNGFYGDCSKMIGIGDLSTEHKRLWNNALDCLLDATAIVAPQIPISAIGDAITQRAEAAGFSVVYQFVGHGVGLAFHEEPQVAHHKNHSSILLTEGMTFTIEPMINLKSADAIIDKRNRWTARTSDGKASAQWEYTLLVTQNGHEILTPWQIVRQS